MFNLEGKTILVTGGARGIGKKIALSFLNCNANIAISSIEDGTELLNELKEYSKRVLYIQSDVSKLDECIKAVEATKERFGSVDVLVNNAGITKDNLIVRMKEEDFDAVINVNLKGTWNMCKAVAKTMMKQRSGRIINISSVVSLMGNAGQSNYVASKSAINGLTKTLAKELAPRNINVNAIAPGFIETEMTKVLSEEIINAYKQQIPLHKLGQPQDIADAALFLASDYSSYITGQIISVNGGMV